MVWVTGILGGWHIQFFSPHPPPFFSHIGHKLHNFPEPKKQLWGNRVSSLGWLDFRRGPEQLFGLGMGHQSERWKSWQDTHHSLVPRYSSTLTTVDCDHCPWVFWGNDKNWWIAGNYTIVTLVLYVITQKNCRNLPNNIGTNTAQRRRRFTTKPTWWKLRPKRNATLPKSTKVVASKKPLPSNFLLLFLFFVRFACWKSLLQRRTKP